MPKLITFGSCLSRRMALLMVKERGWELKSAVMQTKIGQYVRQLNGDRPRLNELTVLDVLSLVKTDLKDYETVCNNISQQQTRVMGTFSTATDQDLDTFEFALEDPDLNADDMVLIDTFTDVLFRSSVNEQGEEIFAPVHKLRDEFKERWALQEKESVQRIVNNVETLCAYIRQKQKSVRIVVLNFPFGLNPSEETQSRANELERLLNQSKGLQAASVEVLSLPTPSQDDCAPVTNYHHYRRTYYRNAVRLLGQSKPQANTLVVAGSQALLDSLKGRLPNGLAGSLLYEQRIDSIVEREVWKSKSGASCEDDERYSRNLDIKKLPMGATIVIDAKFNVTARLSYGSIDEVGTASSQQLPLVEKRALSLKKLVIMMRSFVDWVQSQRPDCHVVIWLESPGEKDNLSEHDQKRLSVLSRMTGSLPVTLCSQNWLELGSSELENYLFGRLGGH